MWTIEKHCAEGGLAPAPVHSRRGAARPTPAAGRIATRWSRWRPARTLRREWLRWPASCAAQPADGGCRSPATAVRDHNARAPARCLRAASIVIGDSRIPQPSSRQRDGAVDCRTAGWGCCLRQRASVECGYLLRYTVTCSLTRFPCAAQQAGGGTRWGLATAPTAYQRASRGATRARCPPLIRRQPHSHLISTGRDTAVDCRTAGLPSIWRQPQRVDSHERPLIALAMTSVLPAAPIDVHRVCVTDGIWLSSCGCTSPHEAISRDEQLGQVGFIPIWNR